MSERAAIEAAAGLLGPLARRDEPLGPRTTYRVGGPAALFVCAASEEDLAVVAGAVAETGVEALVLGRGSNLLVADEGFRGLVVSLGESFSGVARAGPDVLRAGGMALLPVVARRSVAAGLAGFEWAVGVPGSIGGAVRMNAGGHGSDMAASLRRARVLDLRTGEQDVLEAPSLELGYRRSGLRAHQVVIEAEIALAAGDRAASEAQLVEVVAWRRANQPGGANAGSVFTNPPGASAAALIEAAGCKGLRVGTAQVSPKHANFIQALPGGSASDVAALMRVVQAAVGDLTGVTLVPETHLVGFEGKEVPNAQVELER